MARSINASTLSALQGDSFRICHLISIDIGAGIYLTDFTHDIDDGSNVYEAGGGLIGVSGTSESSELRVGSVDISLSSVNQAYLSIFLSQNWINKSVVLSKAVIDNAGQIIGEPVVTFDGLLSSFQVSESDSTSSISLQVASHWADFDRKAGRLTNNNSQQFYFAGDLGMEFAANTVKDIKWGKA
jgi:hypothetical protein